MYTVTSNVPKRTALVLSECSFIKNENHFVNFTGATFALATYVFTLACIRVVYINKFLERHENLFYRKYSLEKKTASNE